MKKFFKGRNSSIIIFLIMIGLLIGVVIYSNIEHDSSKPKKSDIKLNFEPVTETPIVTEEQSTNATETSDSIQKVDVTTEAITSTEISTESSQTTNNSVKTGSIDFWTNWEKSNFEDMYVYKPDADNRFADMLGNLISGYIIGCPATTREFEDTYAKGFLPNVKSVAISNIDSLYNNADALVTFDDDTTKTYTVSWTITSDRLIDTLSVIEKQ